MEEFRGGDRVAGHEQEEPAADEVQFRHGCRHHGFPAEEIAALHGGEFDALGFQVFQPAGNVRAFHEAVGEGDFVNAGGDFLGGGAVFWFDLRHVERTDVNEENLLVQHLVVFEVMQQRVGNEIQIAGHEHGGAGNADCARLRQAGEEGSQRQAVLGPAGDDQVTATAPGGHDDDDCEADDQRNPAAFDDF